MVTHKRTDRSERRFSGVAESSTGFWDEYRAKNIWSNSGNENKAWTAF